MVSIQEGTVARNVPVGTTLVGVVSAGFVSAGLVSAGVVLVGVAAGAVVAGGFVVAGVVGVVVGSSAAQPLSTMPTVIITINEIRKSFFTTHLL